jgi:hypothetical protein
MAAWIEAHANTADIMLVVLLLVAAWVVWKAQQRQDFDFAEMLVDQDHKASALRLGILGSFAISSWIVLHDTLAGTISDWQFGTYLTVWSGAKVAETFAQRWGGKKE